MWIRSFSKATTRLSVSTCCARVGHCGHCDVGCDWNNAMCHWRRLHCLVEALHCHVVCVIVFSGTSYQVISCQILARPAPPCNAMSRDVTHCSAKQCGFLSCKVVLTFSTACVHTSRRADCHLDTNEALCTGTRRTLHCHESVLKTRGACCAMHARQKDQVRSRPPR